MSSAASMVIWVKKIMSDGKLRQARHQLKTLCPDGLELIQAGRVVLLCCQAQIGKSHGIEIVVGQCDEAEIRGAAVARSPQSPHPRRVVAGAARRSAKPSRKNNAWDSREPSVPKPTCSSSAAPDPSVPGRKSEASIRPPS